MDLLLATHNAHKTVEFAAILGGGFRVLDLSGFPDTEAVDETGQTFAENAILKAKAASRLLASKPVDLAATTLCLADDSGLEVDSLGGEPGVRSARYAGDRATDQENIAKLLRAIADRHERRARFRCLIAVAQDGNILQTFEGIVRGTIVTSPRGRNGFGYDPIFVPEGFKETFAELEAETKNRISHRANAIRELKLFLSTQ